LACVHCGSVCIKRNGKYRSRQRYLCKDCGKLFNDMTASPLSGTHHPHKWLKYFQLMVEGVTLPKIAEQLDIHVSTAFYWRHKILNALRSLGFSALRGIIKSDETYFLESDKGKKSISHRKPRNEEARLINVGSVKNKLASLLTHEIVLSTDSATNYKAFAKKKGIPEITNSNKGEHVKKGVYHIQHVNAYHQRLKKWME